jgi:adenylyltransferase/sulfurtransferase
MFLDKGAIERFSRQLLVPGLSPNAQKSFDSARVSIVGAGGLGCPAALYLAAAGIGTLRLIDADTVDASNLHRQVLHTEASVNTPKVQSAKRALEALNPTTNVETFPVLLDAANALCILQGSTVIVDATDNVVTRYLLNDVAYILKVPLVSGAALGWSGQLSVFDPNADDKGPCYRCLYPEPPPQAAVCNCDEGGVVGPVTGLIGSLQALQVLRILAGLPVACTDSLLSFNGDAPDRLFRQLKLRKRNPNCIACGQDQSAIYNAQSHSLKMDYRQWCRGMGPSDKRPDVNILSSGQRISPDELGRIRAQNGTLVIDVRPPNQFALCSLPESLNFPYIQLLDKDASRLNELVALANAHSQIICICRRGNDSQRAVSLLRSKLPETVHICDVIGGLRAYAQQVDPDFPIY